MNSLTLYNRSASGVLLLEIAGSQVAVTFGHAHHRVRRDAVVADFGLKTVLNAVDEDRLDAIDRTRIDEDVLQAREQSPAEGRIERFGIDVQRDMLRGAAGSPSDPNLGSKLAGADALHATIKLEIDELPDYLARLLHAYSLDNYKQKFPWVDNVRPIHDHTVIDPLNQLLVDCIASGAHDQLLMAAPELVSAFELRNFTFSGDRNRFENPLLRFDRWFDRVGVNKSIDIPFLKHHHINAISSATGTMLKRWTVYECLCWECDHDGHRYLLHGGRWYRLDVDFVTQVTDFVRAINGRTIAMAPFTAGENEQDYNLRAAGTDSRLCCLDRNNIPHGGGHSKIEPCDIVSDDGSLIFVKRYACGSGTLSHLFAQAWVSAETLKGDQTFRQKVHDALPATHQAVIPVAQLPDGLRIAFAVCGGPTADRLPFFSRVNLREHTQRLRNLGYRVEYAAV